MNLSKNQQQISIYKKCNTIGDEFFVFWIGLIAILLFLRDVGQINIPKVLFVLLAGIICASGTKTNIYCLLGFVAPLANGLPYNYISILALVSILFRFRLTLNPVGVVSALGILLIELLSVLRGNFLIGDYIRFSVVFLICFLLMIGKNEDCDYVKVIEFFIVGYVIAMFDLIGQIVRQYSFSDLLTLGVRIGNTRELNDVSDGMLLSFNPNGLAMVCILASAVSILLFQKKKRLRYIVITVFSILIGITTQSRSFVLLLAILLFGFLVVSDLTKKSKFAISLGLIASWFVENKFLTSYVSAFTERMQTDDPFNGRLEITAFYFKKMFQQADRLMFGVGLQNYQEKYGYAMSCHNAIQEIMVTWGVSGLIFVVILFVVIYKNARTANASARFEQFLPFLLILIFKQFGQGFSDTVSILWIMVAYCAIAAPLVSSTSKG